MFSEPSVVGICPAMQEPTHSGPDSTLTRNTMRRSSRNANNGSITPRNAPIEKLPAEVRHHLLSVLDLDGMRKLVHASPVFHEQYVMSRRSLLTRSLRTELGSVFPEAVVINETGTPEFAKTRTVQGVDEVVEELEGRQTRGEKERNFFERERLSLDAVISMAAFHFAVVKPLVAEFCGWAFKNLGRECCHAPSLIAPREKEHNCRWQDAPLSPTEEIRLYRGFYRFQLFCNLFGVGQHDEGAMAFSAETQQQQQQSQNGNSNSNKTQSLESVVARFVGTCEPWELEEMGGVRDWVEHRYKDVFRQIYWNLHPENDPEGGINLSHWSHESLRPGTASRGLHLVHTVTFDPSVRGHNSLAELMRRKLHKPVGPTLEDAVFSREAQAERRNARPSPRDHMQARREKLTFRGDGDVSLPVEATQQQQIQLQQAAALLENMKDANANVAETIVEAIVGDYGVEHACEKTMQKKKSDAHAVEQRATDRGDQEDAKECRGELYPPSAWTSTWRGSYSNLYGEHVKGWLRQWGCIMWDADRLRSSGALGKIEAQPSHLPVTV